MPPAVRKRLISFRHAFAGIAHVLRTQPNMLIHASITVAVVAAGFLFNVSAGEWVGLVIAIGMVWTAELINTAVETTVDLVTDEVHPLAKIAKDVAAGAVLISAITAVVIGLIIFLPYLLKGI